MGGYFGEVVENPPISGYGAEFIRCGLSPLDMTAMTVFPALKDSAILHFFWQYTPIDFLEKF